MTFGMDGVAGGVAQVIVDKVAHLKHVSPGLRVHCLGLYIYYCINCFDLMYHFPRGHEIRFSSQN